MQNQFFKKLGQEQINNPALQKIAKQFQKLEKQSKKDQVKMDELDQEIQKRKSFIEVSISKMDENPDNSVSKRRTTIKNRRASRMSMLNNQV